MRGPFRGSLAIRRGLVTRKALRGPRFRQLYPDVYMLASEPLDLARRSRGAYRLVAGHGALAGYSAAELLGSGCAPPDADAEVIVPRADFREYPGLRVHRDRLADDEVVEIDEVLMTSPLRTAYDLARWLPLTEAVAAVDALTRCGCVPPTEVLRIDRRYPGARWRRRVPKVAALSDPRAESVMESRCRLALVLRGLPRPELQYEVRLPDGGLAYLDMAYVEQRLAVEYDGDQHRERRAFRSDLSRQNQLVDLGWTVLRFTADDVLRAPDAMAARVRRALHRRPTVPLVAELDSRCP